MKRGEAGGILGGASFMESLRCRASSLDSMVVVVVVGGGGNLKTVHRGISGIVSRTDLEIPSPCAPCMGSN